jgi:hypothetical protein
MYLAVRALRVPGPARRERHCTYAGHYADIGGRRHRAALPAIDAPGHGGRPKTAAGRVCVPVEFLLQWDDELVPRERGLALFGALGSGEKTLHANPGRHREVPAFGLDSSVRFFTRHLAGPAT